jgi:hypothetical protein
MSIVNNPATFLFRVKSVEQFANDTCEADTCVDAEWPTVATVQRCCQR